MASFDRIDGLFVGKCSFEERFIFKRNDWEWSKAHRAWVTPDIERARNISHMAVGNAKKHIENAAAMKEALVAASWAEDSDMAIPAPEGLAYMPFQRAGIEYAASRDHVLVADAPGLGKTVQAIGIHNLKRFARILVVCPASLKINWQREWRKWDVHGLSVGIAESKSRSKQVKGVKSTWTDHIWPDTAVVIVNYDMLETFNDQLTAQSWDMLVCDEAHLLKTQTTIRSKCVFGGKKPPKKQGKKVIERAKKLGPIRAKHNVFLTGTPILSQPSELWTLVRACDPTGLGRNWDRFVDRYCDAYPTDFGLDVSGASNIEELNRLLRERFMVRRDKKAVLKELPPKRREVIVLPHDKLEKPLRSERSRVEKALLAFEQDVLGLDDSDPDFYYISAIDKLGDKIGAALAAQNREEPDWEAAIRALSEPDQLLFTELSMAREEVARAKVGMVVDHVKKQVECGEPVIVFAHHKTVVTDIVSRLKAVGLRVGEITGSVPSPKRQAVVDKFQEGELDVVVGNILAMGVGFTMTRSSLVVFAELDWVPALIEQAEDRAWRHGQKNAVLIQYLVVDGSIEARMSIAIVEKMEVIAATLDARAAA